MPAVGNTQGEYDKEKHGAYGKNLFLRMFGTPLWMPKGADNFQDFVLRNGKVLTGVKIPKTEKDEYLLNEGPFHSRCAERPIQWDEPFYFIRWNKLFIIFLVLNFLFPVNC